VGGAGPRGRRAATPRTPHPALRATFSHKGRRKIGSDYSENTIQILQNLVVPEPENPIALVIQKPRPRIIMLDSLHMVTAIDFDDQFRRMRREIRKERSKRNLPAKTRRGELLPQRVPKPCLGLGSVATQSARANLGAVRKGMPLHHSDLPRPP